MILAEQPRLLLVAGPNGAGKTTVTERGLAHEWFAGCEYINPDFIARDEFGDWNSATTVLQAANVAQERRERCLAEGHNLAFESVFSAPDKVDFVRRAQAAGFFTRVFVVATADPSINAARVARRVMQGGHDVPIQKIITRHFRSIANCSLVAREVDRLYLYDNSVDGEQAKLVLRAALALDLMEEFRAIFADRLALTLINRGQIGPNDFAEREGGAVLLEGNARRTVVVAYQERKQEEVMHLSCSAASF